MGRGEGGKQEINTGANKGKNVETSQEGRESEREVFINEQSKPNH